MALYYDFLTSKDVNDLEYFEKYMVKKVINIHSVTYYFMGWGKFEDFNIQIDTAKDNFRIFLNGLYYGKVADNRMIISIIRMMIKDCKNENS